MADLVILDKNPLGNIRNTNLIHQVMMNGRLYDTNILDELYLTKRKANLGVYDPNPANSTGLKD